METQTLLEEWLFRVRRSQMAHYEAADHYNRWHFYIGVPTMILSTLVGTSVFATLQKEATLEIKLAVGVASVAAAVLAGLQTFLRYAERAEKHRTVGKRYGAMRRDIEQKMAFPPIEMEGYIESLRSQMDKLNEDCPTVAKRIWDATDARVKNKIHRPA